MAITECAYEAHVVETIVSGRWPLACDPSLVAHAGDCAVCREVVTVAAALHDEEATARQEAR